MYLAFHEHHVSNGTCCESLAMTYQCVANEVIKIFTTKNSTIIIEMNKQFFGDYQFLKFHRIVKDFIW